MCRLHCLDVLFLFGYGAGWYWRFPAGCSGTSDCGPFVSTRSSTKRGSGSDTRYELDRKLGVRKADELLRAFDAVSVGQRTSVKFLAG